MNTVESHIKFLKNEDKREMILESIEFAKKEILNDVLRAVVPEDVEDFGELHDYVDANMYGNTEAVDKLDDKCMEKDDNSELVDVLNVVFGELDRWITNGDLKKDLKKLQNCSK